MRLLEELGAEFERVARATKPRRRLRWFAVIAVVLAGAASAVPATRAGIDDMASWLTGDAGQPAGDDAPDWLESNVRVIARSEGVGLYVSRHDDSIDFAVGEGFGTGASIEEWRKQFADHKLLVLGPASVDGQPWDRRGRFPLMGVTARSVTRVALTHPSGAPDVMDGVRGGFVIWTYARRPLQAAIAYDATGRELERVDISHIDLGKVCRDARGCPPGKWDLAPGPPDP